MNTCTNKCIAIITALLLIPSIILSIDDIQTTNTPQINAKKNIYENLQNELITQCNTLEIRIAEFSNKTIPHIPSYTTREHVSNAFIATRQTIYELRTTLQRPCSQLEIIYILKMLNSTCDELLARTKNNRRLATIHIRTEELETQNNNDEFTFEDIVHLYQSLEQKIQTLTSILSSYNYSFVKTCFKNMIAGAQALHVKTILTRSPKYIALFMYWIAIKPKSDFAGYKEPKKLTWLQELRGEPLPQPEPKNWLTKLKDVIGGIEKKEVKDTRYEKKNVYYGIFAPARFTEGLIDIDTKASLFKICIPALILPAIKKDITDFYAWLTQKNTKRTPITRACNITPLDEDACRSYLETICLINSIPTTQEALDFCVDKATGMTIQQLNTFFDDLQKECSIKYIPLSMDIIRQALSK